MYKYQTIIRVSFTTPDEKWNGVSDFYFSSLAAIYELFPPSAVGCQLTNLWNYGITENRPFSNKKCVISKVRLYGKRQGS